MVAADQLQFLNALFVIILVPVFNVDLQVPRPGREGLHADAEDPGRLLLTAAAVGIMAAAGYLVRDTRRSASATSEGSCRKRQVVDPWPAMAYIVLTFGEVLLYGTMLDLSYAAAPKSMKGYVTACFLLTNTLANFLNILWTPFYGGSLPDPASKRGPLAARAVLRRDGGHHARRGLGVHLCRQAIRA